MPPSGNVGSCWDDEAKRLRLRARVIVRSELASRPWEREQLNALVRDTGIDAETLVLAGLVIDQADAAVRRLEALAPDGGTHDLRVWPE